jgi:SulP family sulfate permease
MNVVRRRLAAGGRWLGSVAPERRFLRADLVAGLPGAISSVPDGMAAAVLVGVNPVQGLYAGFAGPVAGGLTSSTRLMVITTTSAASLAAGSALRGVPEAERPGALLLLALMAGAVLVAAGLAGLGRYTRFVSYSVMIGFLTGISVNIACGQVADLTGAEAKGAFPVAKAVDVIIHPAGIDLASLAAGLGALVILVVLARTRIAMISALIALVVPTVVVILAGAGSVARVGDAGDIPRGIPVPQLPDPGLFSVSLVTGALAVAAIVLVQGAGVAEAAPNSDGAPSDINRDIIAQGTANLASGFFRGVPVGGSVGQTALNVSAGGRTRWSAIWSGVWMLVILVLFSGLVAKVAVPALGAILIFAATGSLKPAEITTIWRTGLTSKIAVTTTFAATLFLPVAAAVGIGVALSLLLQLNSDAMDLAVVELIPREDGRFEERPAPAALISGHVTVLDVYGSLLYAGSRTLLARLPDPATARSPVVVLRLRGRTTLGATFIKIITGYAGRLADAGGRLYLSGLRPDLTERLRRTGSITGPLRAVEATPVVGESTHTAYLDAEAWLVSKHDPPDPPEAAGDGGPDTTRRGRGPGEPPVS